MVPRESPPGRPSPPGRRCQVIPDVASVTRFEPSSEFVSRFKVAFGRQTTSAEKYGEWTLGGGPELAKEGRRYGWLWFVTMDSSADLCYHRMAGGREVSFWT